MRVIVRSLAIAVGLAITATGCASPPECGRGGGQGCRGQSHDRTRGRVSAESLKAAREAEAAVDVELKAQEDKWFKSYDKTRELAVAAKAAGDKAAADAVAGKAAAKRPRPKRKPMPPRPGRKAAVRVGGRIKPPTKIRDVKPVYPAIAQSAHVAGVVTIEATIGPDGKVVDAKVVRSIPMLDQAALDAVRQWDTRRHS